MHNGTQPAVTMMPPKTPRVIRRLLAALALSAGLSGLALEPLPAAEIEAPSWSTGYMSRSRLLTGSAGGRFLAGVEIEMQQGWKTYWRTPGDAGVPPTFDWTGSENLATATVLYPAPRRFTDAGGMTIGYGDSVVFPVALEAKDPGKPVRVRLKLDYGICKEICIPTEATLAADIEGASLPLPQPIAAALAEVPRPPDARQNGDPVLKNIAAKLSGDKPQITLEADFPGGTSGADAFIESADGTFISAPRAEPGEGAQALQFVVDVDNAADLKGQTLTITLVSDTGASETRVTLPDATD